MNSENENTGQKEESRSIILPRYIQRDIYKDLYSKGLLNDDDLNNSDSFKRKIDNILLNSNPVRITIDYRDNILSEASKYLINKKYEYAFMFYTLYFEHEINDMLISKMYSLNKSDKTIISIIRTVNLESKLTWVLDLINLPPFSQKHKAVIQKASEKRNAIVHYKWMYDKTKYATKEEFLEIKKSVTYLKRYKSAALLKGNNKKIDELVTKKG